MTSTELERIIWSIILFTITCQVQRAIFALENVPPAQKPGWGHLRCTKEFRPSFNCDQLPLPRSGVQNFLTFFWVFLENRLTLDTRVCGGRGCTYRRLHKQRECGALFSTFCGRGSRPDLFVSSFRPPSDPLGIVSSVAHDEPQPVSGFANISARMQLCC